MKTDEIKVIISNPEHKKLADFVGDKPDYYHLYPYTKKVFNYPDYSQDWNALMKVVEKIKSLGWTFRYFTDEERTMVSFSLPNGKHFTYDVNKEGLPAVYQAVLKVIEHLEGEG
jgi:hypothetical protein